MISSPFQRLRNVILGMVLASTASAGIRLDFNRTNQTYDWSTKLDHSILRPGFIFNSSFDGESNLVKSKSNRWQENATARFSSEKLLIKRLSLVTSAEYTVNALDKRRVRTSELAAGFSYQPKSYLKLRPIVKIDRIKRSDSENHRNDQGAGYGIEGSIVPRKLYGIDANLEFALSRLGLTNIPSNEGRGVFKALADFRASDTVSISLKGLETSKKYYGSSGQREGILKQIKQERDGNFKASMGMPANLRIRVDANAHISRYLYRHSLTEESPSPQRDNFGRGGGYKMGLEGKAENLATAILAYAWSRSNQDFQGSELDQNIEVGELSFQVKMHISERDSLSSDIFFGVTSYSNPAIGSNRQDRDQKAIVVNGRVSHIFSRFFKAGLNGGANSFHQIYISGAQSANNGRNDTYILTPFAEWRPFEKIGLVQSFDIQANYITFDFDRKKLATRNRIFRRATSRTDLRLVISERLVWEQTYYYRYEDYGQLIWNEGWQQAVSWDRRKNGLETRLVFKPTVSFRIAPDFSWEKANYYSHGVRSDADSRNIVEIRNLSDEQIKMLMAVELIFNFNEARRTRMEFSRRVRKFMERPREITDYANLSMEFLF